jgi:hypothetical protein
VKNVLKANSEYTFRTTLQRKGKGAEINLELKLVKLSAATTVKNKNVGQVVNEPGSQAITLKAIQKPQ